MSQWVFKTVWLYGLVEPVSGESVLGEFSHLDSICFEAFLDYFSQQYSDEIPTKPVVASVTGWDSILDALCVSGIF